MKATNYQTISEMTEVKQYFLHIIVNEVP